MVPCQGCGEPLSPTRALKGVCTRRTCAGADRLPTFPGARYATLAEVPRECPTCSGPCRLDGPRVRCVLCAWSVYIAEMIRETLRMRLV